MPSVVRYPSRVADGAITVYRRENVELRATHRMSGFSSLRVGQPPSVNINGSGPWKAGAWRPVSAYVSVVEILSGSSVETTVESNRSGLKGLCKIARKPLSAVPV